MVEKFFSNVLNNDEQIKASYKQLITFRNHDNPRTTLPERTMVYRYIENGVEMVVFLYNGNIIKTKLDNIIKSRLVNYNRPISSKILLTNVDWGIDRFIQYNRLKDTLSSKSFSNFMSDFIRSIEKEYDISTADINAALATECTNIDELSEELVKFRSIAIAIQSVKTGYVNIGSQSVYEFLMSYRSYSYLFDAVEKAYNEAHGLFKYNTENN